MSQSAIAEDHLFDSLHAALTFAYRYSGQQYSPSIMAKMMRGGGGSGKGLSGLDGAAQAGLVRGLIGHLPMNERNMITAKFSSIEKEKLEAMISLSTLVILSMGTGCHHRRVSDALLQKYFGQKIHLGDIACRFDVNLPTLTRDWKNALNNLRRTWERAEELAFHELNGAGLIP